MNPPQDLLPIGAVARMSGKPASTIRYYERIGLIAAPGRVAGCRRYPPGILRTLAVIDIAQRAGLTLREVRTILAASPAVPDRAERLRQAAARKLPEVSALIERAERTRRWLEAAAGCHCPSLDDCPLFEEPARLPPADPSSAPNP